MKTISSSISLIIILFLGSCGDKLYSLTTTSPGKTYKIQLNEVKTEITSQNLLPYKVTFELERNGRVVVENAILYSGDELDPRFGIIASESEWISEKVIRFGREKANAVKPYDWLEFHNESSQPLTYVFVSWTISNPNPNERFLLLDVKPDEKIRMQVASQAKTGADMSVIGCQGRFEDGKNLGMATRNFKVVGKYTSPSNYSIKVRNSETLIESREYQANK